MTETQWTFYYLSLAFECVGRAVRWSRDAERAA